jgi:hypothetical protein
MGGERNSLGEDLIPRQRPTTLNLPALLVSVVAIRQVTANPLEVVRAVLCRAPNRLKPVSFGSDGPVGSGNAMRGFGGGTVVDVDVHRLVVGRGDTLLRGERRPLRHEELENRSELAEVIRIFELGEGLWRATVSSMTTEGKEKEYARPRSLSSW